MPSRLAEDAELIALLRTLGENEWGVFMLTKGAHTTLAFLESLAVESNRPVMVAALLHDNLNPDRIFKELDAIELATDRGNHMQGQVSCSPMTLEFSLDSAYPFEILDTWRSAIPIYADHGALSALYSNQDFRAGVRADLARDVAIREYTPQFDLLDIVSTSREENRRYEGMSVAEAASADEVDALDWFLDFGIAEDFATTFSASILNADEQALSRVLRHPAANLSLSDAGAHQTLFCDAGFGLHLLGHWCESSEICRSNKRYVCLRRPKPKPMGLRIAAGSRPATGRICCSSTQNRLAVALVIESMTSRPAPRGLPPTQKACTASG